ncbi:MAG: sigma 54-interacting transcriptional regulator [Polyangiaceae bacterium]|nr:sigma 54-interacting transcriptional regulator [Polyangiaceae bacterium]
MSRDGVVLVPISWERPELFVGRDPGCDVCLVDAKVSRRHARLTRDAATGVTLVADLESRNGLTLDGQRIDPAKPVPLTEGSILRIGDAVLVLEERRDAVQPQRVAKGEAFALRVDAEIARAAAEGTTLALVEAQLEGVVGGEGFSSSTTAEGSAGLAAALAAERSFTRAFRVDDVLSSFGDGLWRALLPKTSPAEARQLVSRLRLLLEESGAKPALRMALYPRHGVTSEALVAALADPGEGTLESTRLPRPSAKSMAGLASMIEKIAPSMANVLVLGETGVGKEVTARAIHERSPRASRPLICLNCAAFSEPLLESELFGHERGSFTGAVQAKIGLLEAAEQGTVLFDEIGEMPLSLQAKLLRVLERREVTRVGGIKPRRIDARFVFATHRNLEEEVRAGRFREDLYFRINTVAITIPPLRSRKDEIGPLAAHFIALACEGDEGRSDPPRLSPQALALLEAYSWPGNVRELRNVIERAVLFSSGPFITLEHLPLERFLGQGGSAPNVAKAPTGAPAQAGGLDERARIIDALERCAGNQSAAATLLGISRRTLVSRLSRYDLPRPRKPPGPNGAAH